MGYIFRKRGYMVEASIVLSDSFQSNVLYIRLCEGYLAPCIA
jgi:hypothetical protein